MHELAQSVFDALSSLGPAFAVFVISMLPLVELRLAIPIGCIAGLPWWQVMVLAIIGNLLPVPVIYFLLRPFFNWVKRWPKISRFTDKIEKKLLSKSDKITRYEVLGLTLFVGIPLPGTGAWTGTGIAALLGIRPARTFVSCVLGVVAAAIVMTLLSYGVSGVFSFIFG